MEDGAEFSRIGHITKIRLFKYMVRKLHLQKLKIFRKKISNIFHISAQQNTDSGYLEVKLSIYLNRPVFVMMH